MCRRATQEDDAGRRTAEPEAETLLQEHLAMRIYSSLRRVTSSAGLHLIPPDQQEILQHSSEDLPNLHFTELPKLVVMVC